MILEIKGKVKYKITLDPSVWIFDDRRIDLDTYFKENKHLEEDKEKYEDHMSEYWNREIREGSVAPPTLKTEKKYKKQELLTGTFGMIVEPFINNAEPLEEATKLTIETEKENVSMPLGEGKQLILQFSLKGKPLKEDGPVYALYPDGSNLDNPIKYIKGITIE